VDFASILVILGLIGLLYIAYKVVVKFAPTTYNGTRIVRTKDISCMFIILMFAAVTLLLAFGVFD